MTKILYYATALHGIGPYQHPQILAEEAQKRGIDFTLVLGNPAPDIIRYPDKTRVHHLTPVVKDHDQNVFLNSVGQPAKTNVFQQRVQELRNIFQQEKPDAVVFHNFLCAPHAHNALEPEMTSLIQAAKHAPKPVKVYTSLMDVADNFHNISADKAKGYIQKAKTLFDRILVRGSSLELFLKSCPPAYAVLDKLKLVGYPILNSAGKYAPSHLPPSAIVISAGGSDSAVELFDNAIKAFDYAHQHHIKPLTQKPWVLLVGPKLTAFQQEFRQQADKILAERKLPSDQLQVIPAIDNKAFLSYLKQGASLSVSQNGQNMFTNLGKTDVPAVVVPTESYGTLNKQSADLEQVYRADLLKETGRAQVLSEPQLSPKTLANAMAQALAEGPRQMDLDLDGAKNILDTIVQDVKEAQATAPHKPKSASLFTQSV